MKIDLWYKGEKIAYADCCFYPHDGEYRGNVYNADGMANRKRRYEDNQWNSDHIYEAIWNVIDDYKEGKVNERGERIAK